MSILDIATKVAMADEFYQARDSVIVIIGKEKFKEKVEGFRPIMKGLCEERDISEMQATIEILASLKGRGTGIESLLAMAACTEIMEPSLGL